MTGIVFVLVTGIFFLYLMGFTITAALVLHVEVRGDGEYWKALIVAALWPLISLFLFGMWVTD